jgi:hypothetical protein
MLSRGHRRGVDAEQVRTDERPRDGQKDLQIKFHIDMLFRLEYDLELLLEPRIIGSDVSVKRLTR